MFGLHEIPIYLSMHHLLKHINQDMIRRQSKDKDSTVHRAEYQSTILTLGDFHLKYKTFITHLHLRNEIDFWKVRGIMNTSGLLQSK